MRRRGLLVVISGPAGSGKSTIAEGLLSACRDTACRAITATTRPPRPGEKDGQDYHFLTRNEFEARIASDGFVEHTEFNGNLYGTPKTELDELLQQDKIVLLVIEVEGATNIRSQFPHAVLTFILPPSPAVLRTRLCSRNTECVSDIESRLKIAESEVSALESYDFLIINEDLAATVKDLREIVTLLQAHHIRGGERDAWLLGDYEGWHDAQRTT